MNPEFRFTALLQKVPDLDGSFIIVPKDVVMGLGNRKRIKVNAVFNGIHYRGSIVTMGGQMVLGVTKEIRKKTGKEPGEMLTVSLSEDTEERSVMLPEELKELLKSHPDALEFFATLSFTGKKEYITWIQGAKKEETRATRIRATVQKLTEKKKNPYQK